MSAKLDQHTTAWGIALADLFVIRRPPTHSLGAIHHHPSKSSVCSVGTTPVMVAPAGKASLRGAAAVLAIVGAAAILCLAPTCLLGDGRAWCEEQHAPAPCCPGRCAGVLQSRATLDGEAVDLADSDHAFILCGNASTSILCGNASTSPSPCEGPGPNRGSAGLDVRHACRLAAALALGAAAILCMAPTCLLGDGRAWCGARYAQHARVRRARPPFGQRSVPVAVLVGAVVL